MLKHLSLFAMLTIASNTAVHAYEAPHAEVAPLIDGLNTDAAWATASWESIDQLTVGEQPSSDDFSGRFKVVWTSEKLYLLAEIVDDVLIDTHSDPLDSYWDDDTLEVFIDEDKSGGNHLKSYNAFAYHIALDNQTVDYSSEGKPRTFNDHVTSVWKRSAKSPNKVIWEASFDIYSDEFSDHDNTAQPVALRAGKELGFMVAYCDSDGMNGREHFLGSHEIEPVNGDRNRGYIDASVFDYLKLIK